MMDSRAPKPPRSTSTSRASERLGTRLTTRCGEPPPFGGDDEGGTGPGELADLLGVMGLDAGADGRVGLDRQADVPQIARSAGPQGAHARGINLLEPVEGEQGCVGPAFQRGRAYG